MTFNIASVCACVHVRGGGGVHGDLYVCARSTEGESCSYLSNYKKYNSYVNLQYYVICLFISSH